MKKQRTVHSDQGKDAECSKNGSDDSEEDLAVGVGGNDWSSWSMSAVRDVVGCKGGSVGRESMSSVSYG